MIPSPGSATLVE